MEKMTVMGQNNWGLMTVTGLNNLGWMISKEKSNRVRSKTFEGCCNYGCFRVYWGTTCNRLRYLKAMNTFCLKRAGCYRYGCPDFLSPLFADPAVCGD
jgi:hypothetical protein